MSTIPLMVTRVVKSLTIKLIRRKIISHASMLAKYVKRRKNQLTIILRACRA